MTRACDVLRNQLLQPGASADVVLCQNDGDISALVDRTSRGSSGMIGLAVLPVLGGSAVARFVNWALMLRRVRRCEALARRGSLIVDGRLGVFPSVEKPWIVFELQGSASRYAEAELLHEPMVGIAAILRRMLRRVGGISPSLGGVVLVVRKP
jgi:hypothetical protein